MQAEGMRPSCQMTGESILKREEWLGFGKTQNLFELEMSLDKGARPSVEGVINILVCEY